MVQVDSIKKIVHFKGFDTSVVESELKGLLLVWPKLVIRMKNMSKSSSFASEWMYVWRIWETDAFNFFELL